jgi:hypothetical protein
MLEVLEELCERIVGVEEESITEAEELGALAMETSKGLVDLGLPPIQRVPWVTRKAHEVLEAVGVFLECLREAHVSSTGP